MLFSDRLTVNLQMSQTRPGELTVTPHHNRHGGCLISYNYILPAESERPEQFQLNHFPGARQNIMSRSSALALATSVQQNSLTVTCPDCTST